MGERPTCGYCGGALGVEFVERRIYAVDSWTHHADGKIHSDCVGDEVDLLDRQRDGYRCLKCGKCASPHKDSQP